EEKFGTLTRKTVGEKNLNKTNRTILLVGETGTGKSTLINTLVNYTMGVKFEDNIWFEIVEEEPKREQCESQTSDVIVYKIFGYEGKTLPYSLTIIDTPGYGDTRGIKHDDIISQRLLDLFRSDDGVHELSAVGLVLKASLGQVSDRLRYIFDSVRSLFGKDLEENIVALITHSDRLTPKNVLEALEAANIKCAKDEENEPVHFLFNNRQNTQRTEKDKLALEYAWRTTEAGMKGFTDFLKESNPQKLVTTVEVLNTRIRLTACIQNLQERIQLIDLKQREIQQTEEVLKNHEEEMKKNKEFIVEVDEVYTDKEIIDGGIWGLFFYDGAVTCNVCKENCHYPGCTKAWKPKHCEVMKRGRCTVCTKKCPASDHVKKEWKYVTKTRKVPMTQQDMKEKYEKNKSENENKRSLMEHLQTEMKELTAEKIKLLDEAYQHVEHLERIALNDNSLSIHVHLDFLIEKMKERGDTEKVEKLEEMKRRRDEGTRAGLKYMIGKAQLNKKIS
ncbi:septin-5-like, partial [Scomber japonicus]|uniref:septin-5-like n=1 Tax=Scomber japonicus TaxID=13676 RepID=UPI002304D93E